VPPAPAGRFLEVGTGSGERLVQFAGAGWDVVGQDIDPKAGHLARAQGVTVHDCDVAELVGREAPFDLIGLSHVLEHAGDPGEMLRACAALLAPGGRICVISPNANAFGRLLFGRWWFGLEQPRHLAIPTVGSLAHLTARLGLATEDVDSVATNGAVILGGSLARPLEGRLPGRVARFSTACLGQVLSRVAVTMDHRLGEEVVWVGGRP
jgi:SAM-dependent methyltransferase